MTYHPFDPEQEPRAGGWRGALLILVILLVALLAIVLGLYPEAVLP